jgi:hypothetical protein
VGGKPAAVARWHSQALYRRHFVSGNLEGAGRACLAVAAGRLRPEQARLGRDALRRDLIQDGLYDYRSRRESWWELPTRRERGLQVSASIRLTHTRSPQVHVAVTIADDLVQREALGIGAAGSSCARMLRPASVKVTQRTIASA